MVHLPFKNSTLTDSKFGKRKISHGKLCVFIIPKILASYVKRFTDYTSNKPLASERLKTLILGIKIKHLA